MDPKLLYFLLLQLSLFAVGASLFAIGMLAWKRPRRWGFYVMAKLGAGAIAGVILSVIDSANVQASSRLWVYVAALVSYGVGVSGVAKDISERAGRRSAVGGVPDWDDEPQP